MRSVLLIVSLLAGCGAAPTASEAVYMRSVVITAENADHYKSMEPPTFDSLLEAAQAAK